MFSGHPDLCELLERKKTEFKSQFEMFGLPTGCPVPEGRRCMDGTKKFDFSKFKHGLPMMQGRIVAHYDVTHDTV